VPVLQNARHECFAQEMARGAKLEEAHSAAGLSGNRKSAWKIRQRADVVRRIEELLDRRQLIETKAVEQAITATALSQAEIIRMLLADRELARERGQVGPAIRAAELLGKIVGVFIERREQGKPGDFAHLSDDELDAAISSRLKARGLSDRQVRNFLLGPHRIPANSDSEAVGNPMSARRGILF
jgi:hypothetical protein